MINEVHKHARCASHDTSIYAKPKTINDKINHAKIYGKTTILIDL